MSYIQAVNEIDLQFVAERLCEEACLAHSPAAVVVLEDQRRRCDGTRSSRIVSRRRLSAKRAANWVRLVDWCHT